MNLDAPKGTVCVYTCLCVTFNIEQFCCFFFHSHKSCQRSILKGWYVQPVASYSYTVPQMVYSVGNWPPVVSQQYPTVYQQQPSLPFGPTYGNRGHFTTPATVDRTYLPPTTTRRPNSTPPDRTYLPVPSPSPNSEGPVDGGLGNRFNFENNPDRFVFDVVYDNNRVNYNLSEYFKQWSKFYFNWSLFVFSATTSAR